MADGYVTELAGQGTQSLRTGVLALLTALIAASAAASAAAPDVPPDCWGGSLVQRIDPPGSRRSFGWSFDVADITGDGYPDLIVGEPNDIGGYGAVVLYVGTAAGLDPVARQRWTTGIFSDDFGGHVRAVGDVDGDGFGDLMVVGSKPDAPIHPTQHAWLLNGGPLGIARGTDWTALTGGFAFEATGLGDMDADGHADIALSNPMGPPRDRMVPLEPIVVRGSASGLELTPSFRLPAPPEWMLGTSLLGGHDLNGDGHADLIFTATDTQPLSAQRHAMVHLGEPGGFASAAAWSVRLDTAEFGHRPPAVLPDMDGDGYPELAVGEPRHVVPPPGSGSGQVRIFHGGSAGPEATASTIIEAYGFVGGLGLSLCAAGDVDGDGFQDLAVVASVVRYTSPWGTSYPSVLFLYYGTASGLEARPGRYAFLGELRAARFSESDTVRMADLNSDGLSDLLVGRPEVGMVLVYLGSPRNILPTCSAPSLVPGSCRGTLLQATASDPEGAALTAEWTTSCAGATFTPGADVLNPVVMFDPYCAVDCDLVLTVSDERCGSATSTTRVVFGDASAPDLVGVPVDAIVACDAVPAPAIVTAADDCDPLPTIDFNERRVDGACPWSYELLREWQAADACGHVAQALQRVTVVDQQPPVIAPSSGLVTCLWPPNGRWKSFNLAAITPTITDNCDPAATWRYVACVGEEAGGAVDAAEAIIAADGSSISVHARRSGTSETGRSYRILGVAIDACGNESAPTQVGIIRVPHDSRPSDRCP